MSTFVMGDLHGAYKAMVQCLHRSGFDRQHDTLIQLGDVTDGFDEVYACVDELLSIPNLIALRGNHDDWFLEFIQTGRHPYHFAQGGEGTLRSYLHAAGRADGLPLYGQPSPLLLQPAEIPLAHRDFFQSQRLFYIDDLNNCFVHAGFNRRKPIEQQINKDLFWDRKLWLEALSWEAGNKGKEKKTKFRMATPFNEVFIGHTRTIVWDTDQPMKAANVNNIDTGGGGGGRVTIMNVATKEYWQSDPVSELYEFSYR
ncbi:metallophosphoesterase [Paraflavitalea sp. CAU 1676]|uniref:metallophosphoesterase n=1 Tax=Paraflavitalea sp. CAU 1676 TaxID=3032598 RepID=UPI0023DA72CD|nr:metallophosphoesterase [Paraflavitalea sp. CAU 1676]MDF2187758.1 metallophosphoesterase [Paraflavitalea sp. CAU 1676]